MSESGAARSSAREPSYRAMCPAHDVGAPPGGARRSALTAKERYEAFLSGLRPVPRGRARRASETVEGRGGSDNASTAFGHDRWRVTILAIPVIVENSAEKRSSSGISTAKSRLEEGE